MARKSIKVIPEKRGRGRPATGKYPLLTARLPQEMIDKIEGWAVRKKLRGRSAALRDLIKRGLRSRLA